jgi:hypothetical protein
VGGQPAGSRALIDLSRGRWQPFAHQIIGAEMMIERPFLLLADEPGACKTKQVIDAVHVLFEQDRLDVALVLSNNAGRLVWAGQEFGQLREHCWESVGSRIIEYHGKTRTWDHGPEGGRRILWVVTNYEFLRSPGRAEYLMKHAGRRSFLILDESSALSSHRSQTSAVVMQLRRLCGKTVLMNGTPISESPLDMFAQGAIMDPTGGRGFGGCGFLDVGSFFQYRARYAVMGEGPGWQSKVIKGFKNLDDLEQRFKPHSLRRLKKDCLDLPEKLQPVTFEIQLTPKTWQAYKTMRDQFVAWAASGEMSTATHGAIKSMRLAQICAGFVGGFTEAMECPSAGDDGCVKDCPRCFGLGYLNLAMPVERIGTEKAEFAIDFVKQRVAERRNFKGVIWCAFREEARLLHRDISHLGIPVGGLWGEQDTADRERTLRNLYPGTCSNEEPFIAVGTPGAGSMSVDLTAADTMLYLSNGWSMKNRVQSEDRIYRQGQTRACWYGDCVAVGPAGQRTIDHLIIDALRAKRATADGITGGWVSKPDRLPRTAEILKALEGI